MSTTTTPPLNPVSQHAQHNGTKKRKSEERGDIKEETVEEDGLYYGELDHDNLEYNEVRSFNIVVGLPVYGKSEPSNILATCSTFEFSLPSGLRRSYVKRF